MVNRDRRTHARGVTVTVTVTVTKPGSCTRALPGIDAAVVDDDGNLITDPNKGGHLVIKQPWPGMLRTLWGDDARYVKAYWSQFDGRYYVAGDSARCDQDGYFWIMGRVDDVLNVSGHRLGTMEVESALVAHPRVAEAAVVGRPDAIKGEALFAFVVLRGARPAGGVGESSGYAALTRTTDLLRIKGDTSFQSGCFAVSFWAVLLFMMVAVSGCTNSVVEMGAERAIEEKQIEFLGDGGLHAFLCGTGIPFSVKGRAGACTAVLAGGQFILVDAGPGSWANIADEQLPASRLSAILLTHFHSDHIAELGEDVTQSWMRGRRGTLDVYGPEGVEQVVAGFDTAYALDRGYRTTEYEPKNMPPEAGRMRAHTVKLPGPDGATLVIEKNGLKVIAFAVKHDPTTPAYGYRFEYRGKVLVISGDTSKSENLIKYASGADVLIHEVVAKHLVDRGADYLRKTGHVRFAEMARDAQSSHTSASEAVDVALRAKVKKLVFTHLAPALPPATPAFIMRWVFFNGFGTGFNGPVIFGTDGMWIHE